jgi:hypothetical protein
MNKLGSDLLESLLFFRDNQRNYVLIKEIMDKVYTDRIHYELEKIPENVFTLNEQLKQKCKKLEAEIIKNKEIEFERQKQEELKQEKEREKEEAEQLKIFLVERKNTIYDYKVIDYTKYVNHKNLLEDRILKILQSNTNDDLDLDFSFTSIVDTNKITTYLFDYNKLSDKIFENNLKSEIEQTPMEPVYMNDYTINAKSSYYINYSKSIEQFSVKFLNNKIELKSGNEMKFNSYKNYISSELNNGKNPEGTYKILFTSFNFNNKKGQSLKIIEYKGFGGPQYALVSLFIPGAGNHFVNKGKGSLLGKNVSPWITSIGTVGFVGSGIYLKTLSIHSIMKGLSG